MKSIERPTKLTALVAERLRADILSGQLGPGDHLRQNEVAAVYGVSSTPVREAFAVLERDGLVVVQPHRGATVVEPTIEDLREIYEIRQRLECLAIELACQNPAPNLDPARRTLEQMADMGPADPGRFEINRIFHEQMYALARRPRLERLIADQRDASAIYMTLLNYFVADVTSAHKDHLRIFAALEARDPAEAVAAMAEHLDKTVETVEAVFDQRPSPEPEG